MFYYCWQKVTKLLKLLIFIICLISAVLRVSGALQKSTEVMKSMQALVKIPELQATMMEMSKEMMKVSLLVTTLAQK